MQVTEFVTTTHLLKRAKACNTPAIPAHPGAANR
jgi:hypothetical protein